MVRPARKQAAVSSWHGWAERVRRCQAKRQGAERQGARGKRVRPPGWLRRAQAGGAGQGLATEAQKQAGCAAACPRTTWQAGPLWQARQAAWAAVRRASWSPASADRVIYAASNLPSVLQETEAGASCSMWLQRGAMLQTIPAGSRAVGAAAIRLGTPRAFITQARCSRVCGSIRPRPPSSNALASTRGKALPLPRLAQSSQSPGAAAGSLTAPASGRLQPRQLGLTARDGGLDTPCGSAKRPAVWLSMPG